MVRPVRLVLVVPVTPDECDPGYAGVFGVICPGATGAGLAHRGWLD